MPLNDSYRKLLEETLTSILTHAIETVYKTISINNVFKDLTQEQQVQLALDLSNKANHQFLDGFDPKFKKEEKDVT